MVYPYLIYGNLIWGNTYKTRLQKIMNIQKKLMRLITFKSYSEHTESIFKKLEILNIYQVNDFLTSLFMFRYFNLKNLPEIFVNYFITNKEVHHDNTRKSSQLHKSYKKTNYVTYPLSSKGVDIWNGLNKKYKDIKCPYIFRKEIKKHLLQNLHYVVGNLGGTKIPARCPLSKVAILTVPNGNKVPNPILSCQTH